MPCEPLDALDDLRKQALGQLAFDQLHYEVPGMSDEASAGLEQFARGLLHGPPPIRRRPHCASPRPLRKLPPPADYQTDAQCAQHPRTRR